MVYIGVENAKISILELLKDICTNCLNCDNYRFCDINVWKYKKEAIRKSFLKNIYLDLNGKILFKWEKDRIFCVDAIISDSKFINKRLILWSYNNVIIFINSNYHEDIGLYNIKLDNVICFSRFGDFYISMNVNGGDSSFGRVALRYLIAGSSGAIVASRNSVSDNTFIHDNRETLLFIKENNEEKYLFFEPNFYDILTHISPSKEIKI